jgi:hypothetical protein
MAEVLTQGRTIDSLPQPLRTKVLDMLIHNEPTRKVAALMTEHGYKISHNAVAIYKRKDLPKHLATGRKIQRIQQLEAELNEPTASLAEITDAALRADPILSRVQKNYDRIDKNVDLAEKDSDYKGVSHLISADTRLMTLHAQLTGRLQQQGPTTNVQIVFGAQPRENTAESVSSDGDVIDVRAIQE